MHRLLWWRDRAKLKAVSGRLLIDGSFISRRADPNDFDLLLFYDESVERLKEIDPEVRELLSYDRCKELGFDLWIYSERAAQLWPQYAPNDMFDRDKNTRELKGVLEVRL